jgi:hypothetical protein
VPWFGRYFINTDNGKLRKGALERKLVKVSKQWKINNIQPVR